MKTSIVKHNGVSTVEINGTLYPPLSFKSFRANAKNISEFYQAGVRLFSVLFGGITSALGVPYSLFGDSWVGERQYDFAPIDAQMDLFLQNAPEGYFAPMIQLDTRDWYLEAHPDVPNSFTHLSQIAHDRTWREAASDYLQAVIRHCEEKYGDRIYGYFLLCGTTTEWFSEWDYEASHPIKEAAYRAWCHDDSVSLPSQEEFNRLGDVFLSKEEAQVYRARKFHSQTISDLILYFASQAQAVLDHKKLLGLYYGYLLELGGERIFNDGIFDYERVYLSPDIDMISSPSAYGYRALSDPSAFMVTQKTLWAHNKLYFLEFDHITHVAPEMIYDGQEENSKNHRLTKIPGADNKCKDETESLNLMYRDFLLCNGAGAAMWWFDMFDGWFRSEAMMQAIAKMINIGTGLCAHPTKSAAQIAVFAEGESMYHVRKSSELATLCLSDFRRTMAQCGAAYDWYSIGDLKLPQIEDYRLLIFLNQYDLCDAQRSHIEAMAKRKGQTVLWVYAPDYAHGGRYSVSQISSITGICVTESAQSHGALLWEGESFEYPLAAPYFAVEDPDASILARFQDGAIAAASKEANGYRNVYLATCNLPSALLREIARLAGVFVYSESDHVYVYPNSETLGVYNATEQAAVLSVLQDGDYRDLLTDCIYQAKNGVLTLPQAPIRAFLLQKE